MASTGDGVGSPGDKGDMLGALKGRGVLLSGVDTVATAGWTERQSSAIEGGQTGVNQSVNRPPPEPRVEVSQPAGGGVFEWGEG